MGAETFALSPSPGGRGGKRIEPCSVQMYGPSNVQNETVVS